MVKHPLFLVGTPPTYAVYCTDLCRGGGEPCARGLGNHVDPAMAATLLGHMVAPAEYPPLVELLPANTTRGARWRLKHVVRPPVHSCP